MEKILREEKKIDWKKKIRETSNIREVKNESNFGGGITQRRMGWERLTGRSEIAVDAKNSRKSNVKIGGGHEELLRRGIYLTFYFLWFILNTGIYFKFKCIKYVITEVNV